MLTNQVPATWFEGDAEIRRLVSLCATALYRAVAAFLASVGPERLRRAAAEPFRRAAADRHGA